MGYRAFFSYSRADERIANWLHGQLDRYRTPKDIVASGAAPAKLHPIFRDRTDLQSGGQLDEALRRALDDSEALVVLCTPTSAKSQWVNAECEAFVRAGREDRIFPVIGAGEPNSGNPETECFPPALRDRSLLAADLREVKLPSGQVVGDGREIGRLKLIAGLLGVPLDLLVRRERRRQRLFLAAATASAVAFAVLATAAAGFGWLAQLRSTELARERDVVMLRESSLVAADAREFLRTGAGSEAAHLLLSVLPNAEQPDRPLSFDAVAALASFIEYPSQRVDLAPPDGDLRSVSFSPDGDTALVFIQRESGALTASLVSLSTGARSDIEYAFAAPETGAVFLTVEGRTGVWPLGATRGGPPLLFVDDGLGRTRLLDQRAPWFVDPNARLLADGLGAALIADGGRVLRMDKTSGEITASQSFNGTVVAAHADRGRFAVHRDGVMNVIEFGAAPRTIRTAEISYAAFSIDGERLLVADGAGMRILSSDLSGVPIVLQHSDARCLRPLDLAFGPLGDVVIAGDGAVCRFDAQGRLQRVVTLPSSPERLSWDGEWVLAGDAALRTRGAFRDGLPESGEGYEAIPVCVQAEYHHAASICRSEEPSAAALLIDGRQYRRTRSPVVMSPSRRYMGASSDDGVFAVIDLTNSRVVCTLGHEPLFVFDRGPLVLIGDGRRFDIVACSSATATPDFAFDQGLSVQSGIVDGPQFAALSSDGTRLLTGGPEQSIRLWDLSARALLWSAPTSDRVVGISSDDRYFHLETGTADGPTLWMIQLPPATRVLLDPQNWTPPAYVNSREIIALALPANQAVSLSPRGQEHDCTTTGRRMAQAPRGYPPYDLVIEIIACAGLTERLAAELGDDPLERDLLVMRAAQWPSLELASRYSWLSEEELESLRRAVSAGATE
jgi:WD40 repeat protein